MRTLIPALLLAAAAASSQPLSYSLLRVDGEQPSPRFDGTIAYDPLSRAIFLFGGQDSAPKNDLWEYSLATRRWQEIQVSGPRPPARFGHTLIFDPVGRRLIVFGGQARGFFSDVWSFNIAQPSWQQLSPDEAGPSRRYGHSAIYDSVRHRMVISHGFTDAGRFDDTWAFDLATNSWRDLSPAGGRPLRRCLHHAVYDAGNDQMFLYGGCASGFGPCPLGDLWAFDLRSNRWTEKTGQVKPPAREHYGIAFDGVRGRLLVFGGTGNGILNDTWEYDARSAAWQRPVIAGDPPSPRYRHETAVASDRGTIFFFGGLTANGATNELWMLGPGFILDQPRVSGVANAFSGAADGIAPGELVSIYGSGFGSVTATTVTVNELAAPIFYAAPEQINIQVPYELDGASDANLVVTVNGQSSDAVALPVAATRPGLFPRVWNEDGTINSADNPASPGSVIVVYATGQGVTSPSSLTGALAVDIYPEPQASTSLRVGGVESEILFRGQAPGTAGVMQVNARLPLDLASPASHPVVLLIGSGESQAGVVVAVR